MVSVEGASYVQPALLASGDVRVMHVAVVLNAQQLARRAARSGALRGQAALSCEAEFGDGDAEVFGQELAVEL